MADSAKEHRKGRRPITETTEGLRWLLDRPDERRQALRAIIKRSGLTVTEIAAGAGLSTETAIGNFLNGHASSLNLTTLEPLSRFFGVPIDELVGWKSDTSSVAALPLPSSVIRVVVDFYETRCTIEGQKMEKIAELMRRLGKPSR